jgi:phosphoribosyl-ATP pyrophosphohydrolase
MSTFGHFGEYDEYLRMLAEAQRYKLRLNAHKGFLGDMPLDVLLVKISEEIEELKDAVARGSKIEMLLEAADIANFVLGFVIAAANVKPADKDVSVRIMAADIKAKGPTLEEYVKAGITSSRWAV